MQNIPPELDLLVVGNEPAGLWLLREYHKLAPSEAKVGWLKIDEPIPAIPLTSSIAQSFNIETDPTYSAEIVTQSNLFRWSREKVSGRFKRLEKMMNPSVQGPSLKEREALREAIAREPELLTLAQAIWKRFGRCRRVTPEATVWAALQALEIGDWRPDTLAQNISGLHVMLLNDTNTLNSIEEVPHPKPEIRGKIFSLTLASGEKFFAKSIALNLNLRQLKQHVLAPTLQDWAPTSDDILSPFSHYPITLKLENYRLPYNVQRLNLLLDQAILPEPDREIWPMDQNWQNHLQTITLWATERTDFSFESMRDSLGKALSRLQRLFPDAMKQITHQSVPLGVDSCYSDPQRAEVIRSIEKSRLELYSLSLLHVRTRKKGLYSLLPALHCTLPYPLGTLTGAREILTELLSRKNLKNHAIKTLVHPPTSP